jgi:hypothetical protein
MADTTLRGRQSPGERSDGPLARLAAFARTDYALEVPQDERRELAAGWLLLAVGSLLASGVFSLLLVASRTPGLNRLFPAEDFFRVALVVHVDLSVLVWFVAFAGLLWSLNSTRRWLRLAWIALVVAGFGSALIVVAPFTGRGTAIMANYIPVLDNGVFLAGLVVLAAAVLLLTLRGMSSVPPVGTRMDGAGALRFGLNGSVVATAVALLAFAWSWWATPAALEGKAYYELVFWGGGHVLQFTWTLLMMVTWLWLLSAIRAPVLLSPRVCVLLFGIGLASVFATPVIYLAFPVPSVEHYRILTWLMRFGGGLAILPMALVVLIGLASVRRLPPEARPLRAALASSLVLFCAGGLIGFMIQGSDVKIPAHYHGCIVGITLAFMGITYRLMPELGLGAPAPRLATWQPWVYGGGQLLHVIGLAWSGGYGVQRKVAGAEQVLITLEQKVAMSIMGVGGLIAVGGGLLFLVVVLGAVRARRRGELARAAPRA